jgi:hypothetical protein
MKKKHLRKGITDSVYDTQLEDDNFYRCPYCKQLSYLDAEEIIDNRYMEDDEGNEIVDTNCIVCGQALSVKVKPKNYEEYAEDSDSEL